MQNQDKVHIKQKSRSEVRVVAKSLSHKKVQVMQDKEVINRLILEAELFLWAL